MHICADEIMALMSMVPFVGYGITRLQMWWKDKKND